MQRISLFFRLHTRQMHFQLKAKGVVELAGFVSICQQDKWVKQQEADNFSFANSTRTNFCSSYEKKPKPTPIPHVTLPCTTNLLPCTLELRCALQYAEPGVLRPHEKPPQLGPISFKPSLAAHVCTHEENAAVLLRIN